MKKVTILLTMILIGSISIMSFTTDYATRYGGRGSAKISIYKLKLEVSSGNAKYIRGEKISSSVINTTVSCTYRDNASASEAIESDIKRQAQNKVGLQQEWDYDSSIDFKITSCEN